MCSSKILWLSADELAVVCDFLDPWLDPDHLCAFRGTCRHVHISIALEYVRQQIRLHRSGFCTSPTRLVSAFHLCRVCHA